MEGTARSGRALTEPLSICGAHTKVDQKATSVELGDLLPLLLRARAARVALCPTQRAALDTLQAWPAVTFLSIATIGAVRLLWVEGLSCFV